MKSTVLYKVVYVDEQENVCFCDSGFRKTCVARIANDLPCCETIIRLVPVDREESTAPGGDAAEIGEVERRLGNVKTEFLKTLRHLDRMK